MSNLDYKPFYSRNLPHIQPPGATIFVTYRLAGSIPQSVIEALIEEAERMEKKAAAIADKKERIRETYKMHKQLFGKWDAVLDKAASGPTWLSQPEIAEKVVESLHYRDGRVYDLDSFTIMSNHVHALFTPLEKEEDSYHSLASIMQSLKGYVAWVANDILKRKGQFWQHESYDHFVRDTAEQNRIRQYILNNPVKAGLVSDWTEWPWSYSKYDL